MLTGDMQDSFRNEIDNGMWITDGRMTSKANFIDGSGEFSLSEADGRGTLAMVRDKGKIGGDR